MQSLLTHQGATTDELRLITLWAQIGRTDILRAESARTFTNPEATCACLDVLAVQARVRGKHLKKERSHNMG